MTALVVYLQSTIDRLRDREGQTMAEYALIIGGIAIVVIAGILILGPAIRDLFQSTGSSVQTLPELLAHRVLQLGVGSPRRVAGPDAVRAASRAIVVSAPRPPDASSRSRRVAELARVASRSGPSLPRGLARTSRSGSTCEARSQAPSVSLPHRGERREALRPGGRSP